MKDKRKWPSSFVSLVAFLALNCGVLTGMLVGIVVTHEDTIVPTVQAAGQNDPKTDTFPKYSAKVPPKEISEESRAELRKRLSILTAEKAPQGRVLPSPEGVQQRRDEDSIKNLRATRTVYLPRGHKLESAAYQTYANQLTYQVRPMRAGETPEVHYLFTHSGDMFYFIESK